MPEDIPEDTHKDTGDTATDSESDDADELPADTQDDATSDVNSEDTGDTSTDSESDDVGELPADTQDDAASDVDAEDTGDAATNTEGDRQTDSTATEKYEQSHGSDSTETMKDSFDFLSDYMNKHNYGPDDFAEYSQDPEWRALQSKAFPDYELPPLTQENAYNQLSNYMNDHNYGPDDFAEYSQDPQWRELQSAAFPDYHLPPLDTPSDKVDLNQDAFDAVPDARRDAVDDTFADAPAGIKSTINDLSGELNVSDTRKYLDENGVLQEECCHYDPDDDVIRMEPGLDDGEYAEVFRHEYGHFADAKLGDLSTSDEFVNALNNDMLQFNGEEGFEAKQQMLDDLASNGAIDDRCVSDILSGTFNNDYGIMDRYKQEGADYWNHSNDYWNAGPAFARERETFANMFSVYSANGRNDSIAFLEKYYPSTTAQFKKHFFR